MQSRPPVFSGRARRRQRIFNGILLAAILAAILLAGRYVIGPALFWLAEQI